MFRNKAMQLAALPVHVPRRDKVRRLVLVGGRPVPSTLTDRRDFKPAAQGPTLRWRTERQLHLHRLLTRRAASKVLEKQVWIGRSHSSDRKAVIRGHEKRNDR